MFQDVEDGDVEDIVCKKKYEQQLMATKEANILCNNKVKKMFK